MKEYLEKQADGSYELVMRGIVGRDDDIEVPEGADCARSTCGGLEFYKDNLNLFFSISGDCWKNTISTKERLSQNIVWQRHTQPEELPFVDSLPEFKHDFGASSLNDQYAEIEQVRQSAIKTESGGDSDHMADAMSYGYMDISAPKKHRHYFKDVSNITEIDVYAVLKLFDVTDPCLQHIVKKALCAGKRGHKDMMEDLQNIVDTAIRAVELNS